VLGKLPDNRYSPFGPYWFDDLKQAYEFPSYKALTGQGRNIAIVMSSDFQDSDIAAYFAREKLAPPTILRRPVLGGAPFDPQSGASLEVSLDLEQAGGMAPGAQLILYNIPNLADDSILGAYLDIVEENRADIVSSSFGGPEGLYTAAYNGGVDETGVLRVFNQLFQQGNAQGITFVASSGDNAALGLPPIAYFTTPPQRPPVVVGNFELGIGTPASDPNVTAVGGTVVLQTTSNAPNRNSAYLRETAFPDPMLPEDPYGTGNLIAGGYFGPGGGKSIVFQKPAYQRLVKTGSKMRTIPDISLLCGGCPGGSASCNPEDSSAVVAFNAALYAVVGTSVAAPGFAGLLALEEQHLGGVRLGNVNFQIYAESALQNTGFSPLQFFHQNIPGFNGEYTTHHGYNLVTGNGTPIGINFIFAPEIAPAGIPQTPSNP
jgi:kumamolisin